MGTIVPWEHRLPIDVTVSQATLVYQSNSFSSAIQFNSIQAWIATIKMNVPVHHVIEYLDQTQPQTTLPDPVIPQPMYILHPRMDSAISIESPSAAIVHPIEPHNKGHCYLTNPSLVDSLPRLLSRRVIGLLSVCRGVWWMCALSCLSLWSVWQIIIIIIIIIRKDVDTGLRSNLPELLYR